MGWIAKGGMGDVFKAEHRSMGRTVALKVINKKWIRDEEVVKRFHREVRTAARLSHPNIVTAYDAEQTENIHFLVMEFVDGMNLATLVRGRKLINQSFWLSKDAAKELQAKANSDPNDIESRLQLLGYYNRHSILNKSLRESHTELACWLIENYPDSRAAGSHAAHVTGTINPLGYVKARLLWLDTVKIHDQNVTILLNASGFFLLDDNDLSEELLKKAEAIEPDNIDITKKLAQVYQLFNRSGDSKAKLREQNDKEMVQLERALARSKEGTNVSQLLIDIAKTAFKSGENDKAKQFAERLLKTYGDGDSIHMGNQILGRLSLQAGDIDKAGKYLITSARTVGSPVLNSFGPSMILAKELLEKDQKDIVLEYFDLCEKFWLTDLMDPANKLINQANNFNKLKEWREIVKVGGVPEFGMSLSR